jgi:hypothetical protein
VAIPLVEQGLEICREMGYQLYIASRYCVLGWVANNIGAYARARQYGQEGLIEVRQLGSPIFNAYLLGILGEAYSGLGEFETSRKYLLEALQLASEHRLLPQRLEALYQFAYLLVRESEARSVDEPTGLRQKMLALELLTQVVHHPKCRQDRKDKAARFLARLVAELPAEQVATARKRAEMRSLDEMITLLLARHGVTGRLPDTTPGLINRRYLQESLIARGGMGEVYLGLDTETGQQVAIKRLRPELAAHKPEAVQRLVREGEILRQLNHPNIVKVLATVEKDGQPIIVMEYVSGGSLRDLLEQQPQLPLERALDIALELADALARAHHLHIIHRDIKPGNILLAADGAPRLVDFGVAYLGQEITRLTQEGTIVGTSTYMSPEAWRGEELDARSDVWSFGAVLYEMLAGQPPFAARQIAAIITSILTEPAPDLTRFRPDVPPALADLIQQMLVKERDLRIDSMRQVAAGLEVIQRMVAVQQP